MRATVHDDANIMVEAHGSARPWQTLAGYRASTTGHARPHNLWRILSGKRIDKQTTKDTRRYGGGEMGRAAWHSTAPRVQASWARGQAAHAHGWTGG